MGLDRANHTKSSPSGARFSSGPSRSQGEFDPPGKSPAFVDHQISHNRERQDLEIPDAGGRDSYWD
jgi:hypothetical protein